MDQGAGTSVPASFFMIQNLFAFCIIINIIANEEVSNVRQSFQKMKSLKKAVKENVKMLYRKTIDEATQQQIFQAVSLAVKDVIIDNWLATQKQYEKDDPKIVYYLSMEFLMGRALGNNLINLTAYKEVKEALDELGFDLNVIEDQERIRHWVTEVWEDWQQFPGFPGNSGILCIWLWYPLSLWSV